MKEIVCPFQTKSVQFNSPFLSSNDFFTNALLNVPKGQGQFDVISFREKLKNQKHNHENLS